MAVLSVMAIKGDPEELVASMNATLDPVARRKAPRYGGISSTVVRTDEGIKIFNLWQTDEGRHQMADDPEVRAAIQKAGFPEPNFTAYEVLTQRSAGDIGKDVARRIADEVWSQGKLDVIDELIAEDFVGTDPVNGEIHGRDGFRQLVEMYRTAFADSNMRVDTIVAEGDLVAAHWTATGTHTGSLMGIAPTGNEVKVSGTEFSKIVDGKIASSTGLFDALGMLQQIGAVPALAVAATA